MSRHIVILWLLGSALALRLVAAAPSALDTPADPADWRTVRELQNKTQGAPELPPDPGTQGALLMSAAELGSGGGSGKGLANQDYDALYSLLQRYRDELAGMGLDYDKYMARLADLKRKSEDLSDRLENLHPLDGMKIHGGLITSYSNLHILGPRALSVTYPPASSKPANQGIRYEGGIFKVNLVFDLTKGPVSAMVELNLISDWYISPDAGFGNFGIEIRTPVALQFGKLDENLSPLTLWRNEDSYPFETEPFKGRRDRARSDLKLVPDKVRMIGARISTQAHLFDALNLDLESISSMVGNPYTVQIRYFLPDGSNAAFTTYTTYLEAWRAGFVLPFGLGLGYQGALFFDETDSKPQGGVRPMTELTQSGQLTFKSGGFVAAAEFAGSAFQEGTPLVVSPTAPLAGSAILVSAGLKGAWGQAKLYGRSVNSGFHASGAQTRTQDANYNYLGPLMTEITQINQDDFVGPNGKFAPPSMPEPHWFALGMIAPGSRVGTSAANSATAGVFSHLLPYDFLNDISPYGMATPNRQGFGAEGDVKIFGGIFVPKLGIDMATQIEPVNLKRVDSFGTQIPTSKLWKIDSVGNTMGNTMVYKPLLSTFMYQQIRGGMDINFKLFCPIKLSAGYTMHDTREADMGFVFDKKGQALPFALSSTLLQGGVEIHPTDTVTIAAGYNHIDASGFSDTLWVSNGAGVSYDQMAYSVFYTISEITRVDLLYEDLSYASVEIPKNAFLASMGMIRVHIDF